jgi:hypothetical protein
VLAIHRWAGEEQRLVLLNFGEAEFRLDLAGVPGVAPGSWEVVWSVGGGLAGGDVVEGEWGLAGRSAVVLKG